MYLDASMVLMTHIAGPTMIPPWEAFKMKVPVFYSDIHNIKKVYLDAVYYIDPLDPRTMASGIKNLTLLFLFGK